MNTMRTRIATAALVLSTALAGSLAAPVAALEIAKVNVPDSATVGGSTLKLNGAGIRSKFFVKVYVGALYLRDRTTDAGRAASGPGNKRVALHFLHKSIDADKIRDAWREGFDANLGATQRAALAADIDAFMKMWPAVKSGDTAYVDVIKGTGTTVTINGEVRGTISNEALASAVLNIWLGNKPADKSLKSGMLGG